MPTDRDRSVVEELRQRILELKEALDNEKAKTKQIQHDKVAEIKHIKEQETLRYEQEKISLKKKYLKEKNGAVNKILESLKKKDRGVGEILQQKEDEIRCLHEELQKERDSDIRSTSSHATEGHLEEARDQWEMEKDKLMKCMFELRSEKLRLEEDYELLKDSDRDKAIMLRQMDDQKQKELQALKRQSALENRKQMEEIRSIERKVMDKEKEISRKSKRLSLIECSKEELQDKLNEQKLSERVNLSMSMIDLNSSFSPKKSADDKERGLQQRNSELQARIKTLEDRCSAATAENEGLRHRQDSASPADKKASVLELQVKQLAAEKRALEEKLLSSNQTSDGHPLEDKMRLQEKEKLAIERTLAQILQHNNIKLPPALKENIENQALQFELNDAVAEKEDNEVIIELKSKVSELDSACGTLRLYNSEFTEREAQLKNVTKQLDSELKTIKEDNLQLVKQLTDARDTLKSLSHENHNLKAEIDRKMPLPLPEPSNDKAVKQTHDLKNEIIKLTAEKQRLLDAEETAKSKIKLLEEVQMQLVKKEEQNGRYYDEVSQKLSLITKEKKELTERVQEYEAQRRFEAEEMASMLNDRNDYLKDLEKREKSVQVIKQDKEYLRKECETYRISNLQLEQRLQKMQKQVNPNSAALIDRITELEENNEVIENLKASTEGLKEHIKKLEAEKVNTKKQHNEELQRVIRTLDKKNKEHVQKSEELRAHIKRLDSDLRNLERSKMENSGNLQIKAQELQQMSEYVKKLETSEHELRQRLEAYQKSTVNGARSLNNSHPLNSS